VRYPDRFEAAHIGHEDIDNQKIECRSLKQRKALRPTARRRNPVTVPLEPGMNGLSDQHIVVDYQDAAHSGLPSTNFPQNQPHRHRPRKFRKRISALFLFLPQT
jgi:hypothetical protein